ncbi:MAG: sigma-54 dependent transcriptional regulator [SAR324 cluster bacterium]|nr:sigma-54 dependent transcriptional regulator [SAR324 cluster bacterium]
MEKTSEFGAGMGVLIVDDDMVILDSLSGYLRLEDWRVECASSGNEALAKLKSADIGFIITDINMQGMSGIDMLQRVRSQYPDIEIIVMTGQSTEDFAIQALKAGAVDYFHKPIRGPEVSASLMRSRRVMELKSRNTQLNALVSRYSKGQSNHGLAGISPAALALQEQLEKVACIPDTTVLLTGESGVGKEVVARRIHGSSRPADAPFVAINCGGISESLLERELFGHEKGAFTGADKRSPGIFEMALGGTVMLDEISEMSLPGQARLLRVLEEKSFRRVGGVSEVKLSHTRIIAATNRQLEEMVRENRFREDLYFRLKVVPVHVPPLKERAEDILPLARHFLEQTASGPSVSFSREAESLLTSYSYPGNIRELKNIVEHAAIFCHEDVIQPADLAFSNLGGQETQLRVGPENGNEESQLNLAECERRLILQALQLCGGNHSAAARTLGITPQALYRRLSKYEIS